MPLRSLAVRSRWGNQLNKYPVFYMMNPFSRLPLWGGLGLCCALLTVGCAQTPNAAAPAMAQAQSTAAPMPTPTVAKVANASSPVTAPFVAVAPAAAIAPLPAPAPVVADAAPLHFEQAWDVVEVMGKPVAPGARVVFRGPGGLLVDGGCNQFSGRVERSAQGLLRVSRYSGSHRECDGPARSEAVLNSALIMATHYQQQGQTLELRNDDGTPLVRLAPSANQEVQSLEQAVARAAPASAHGGKSAKGSKAAKGGKASAHSKGKSSSKGAASSGKASSGKSAKAKKKPA